MSVGIGGAFVAIGIALVALGYLNHDRGSGAVSAPAAVRRALRRGDGPVRVSSVALEVLGLALAILGGAVALSFAEPRILLTVGAPVVVAVLAIDVVLAVADRRGR
jgi:hypothetical protein